MCIFRPLRTYIRDGMAVVQCIVVKKHTNFGDIEADYYIDLVCFLTFAITFVYTFDRYDMKKTSIKSAEREGVRHSILGSRGQNYTLLDKVSCCTRKQTH